MGQGGQHAVREDTGLTFEKLGELIGWREHSTHLIRPLRLDWAGFPLIGNLDWGTGEDAMRGRLQRVVWGLRLLSEFGRTGGLMG